MTARPFASYCAAAGFGRLAQLVRALPSHGRGQRFKSFVAHHSLSESHFIGKHECQPSCVASSFYVWGCGWVAMCFLVLWWRRGRFGCLVAGMLLGLWLGLCWDGCTCLE